MKSDCLITTISLNTAYLIIILINIDISYYILHLISKMNFTKSLTFMLCLIGVALGAKPTDQYKDPYVKPTLIRGALKPTDQYKDTSIVKFAK